jgi:hypothetical protein
MGKIVFGRIGSRSLGILSISVWDETFSDKFFSWDKFPLKNKLIRHTSYEVEWKILLDF